MRGVVEPFLSLLLIILLGYFLGTAIFGQSSQGRVEDFDQLPYGKEYFDGVCPAGPLDYRYHIDCRRGGQCLILTGTVTSRAEIEKLFQGPVEKKNESPVEDADLPWARDCKRFGAVYDSLKSGPYDTFYVGKMDRRTQIELYFRAADGRFICRVFGNDHL